MKRGIFVSRKDSLPNGDIVTTFDIRMKEPNREPVVHQDALHTIEHLAATFLRNHPVWKNKVIYWENKTENRLFKTHAPRALIKK